VTSETERKVMDLAGSCVQADRPPDL